MRKPLALSLLIAALSAVPAAARTVVLDTLNDDGQPFDFRSNPDGISFFNIAALGPLGQSFILDERAGALAVDAFLSTFGSGFDVTASLLSGEGPGGAVLATDGVAQAGISRSDAVLAAFDFTAAGVLDAGTYTVFFEGTGTLGGGDQGVETDGVEAFDEDGAFDFGSNFAREFGVRVTADPVAPIPLPAGAPLLVLALGALGLVRRRG